MLTTDSGNESDDRLEASFFNGLEKNSELLAEVLQNNSDSDAESDIYSKMNDFDVVFHDPKDKSASADKQKHNKQTGELLVDKKVSNNNNSNNSNARRVLTSDHSTESYASSIANSSSASASTTEKEDDQQRANQKLTQINTCKILQRKLELKVERAKRNYRQMYEEQEFNQEVAPKSASLIPISRLPIPGGGTIRNNPQPLVDVDPTSCSGGDGTLDDLDDLEPVSFFPKASSRKADRQKRQELSDTFSIQEMTIESDQEDELDFQQCRRLSNNKGYKKILNRGLSAEGDYLDDDGVGDFEDDEDSQNLELLPPRAGYNLKELAQRAFCCWRRNDFLS